MTLRVRVKSEDEAKTLALQRLRDYSSCATLRPSPIHGVGVFALRVGDVFIVFYLFFISHHPNFNSEQITHTHTCFLFGDGRSLRTQLQQREMMRHDCGVRSVNESVE